MYFFVINGLIEDAKIGLFNMEKFKITACAQLCILVVTATKDIYTCVYVCVFRRFLIITDCVTCTRQIMLFIVLFELSIPNATLGLLICLLLANNLNLGQMFLLFKTTHNFTV